MTTTSMRWMLALAAVLCGAATLHAQNDVYKVWQWKMPGELYKQLNHIQRSQFDKAGKLFEEGMSIARHHQYRNQPEKRQEMMRYFKSATLEWQKIRVQTGDTLSDSALAYVIFMEAHSQHLALNRMQAIRTYTEVMDYFSNEIWIAVPALYFRAEAHFENGDELQGYKSLQAIAEDDGYLKHPLAAGALRRLADNHWANQQFDRAAATWMKAWESYHQTNRDEARAAAGNLRDHYLIHGKFDELDALLPRLAETKKKIDLCDVYVAALRGARSGLQPDRGWGAWYYQRFHNESKARALMEDSRKAIFDWFTTQEGRFREAGRLWDYHVALLGFAAAQNVGETRPLVDRLVEEFNRLKEDVPVALERGRELIVDLHRSGERAEATRVFESLSGIIRSDRVPAAEKESRAAELMGVLAQLRMIEEARSLLDLYTDATRALWAEYTIYERAAEWPGALATLEKIEALKQADDLRQVREKRAWIYHEPTREYDKAIAVYRQIADPPRTLWAIQDCQRRDGKTDEAIVTLTEIASIFPDDAPRAVYTKAEYYRADGKHKLAVALYRQILQRFEKSPQSSQAHQRLEDYGIETGGGVVNELD